MADHSKIEWTNSTWNPLSGCTAVSSGCDHCYAAREASGRLKHLPAYGGLAHAGVFTGEVRLLPDRLDQPLHWHRPRRIFVNSMSDLFHDGVPDEYIARVFAVMALSPRHTFQVLTKRHGRMRALLSSDHFEMAVGAALVRDYRDHPGGAPWTITKNIDSGLPRPQHWPLPNVWLGVSVEDQKWADIRIPVLLDTPAAVRWISAEPLLGPIDLDRLVCSCGRRRWVDDENWSPEYVGEKRLPGAGRIPCGSCNEGGWSEDDVDRPGLDWCVVGGESGRGARPMQPAWAQSLRDQCVSTGVAFHFKQWGEYVAPDHMTADTFMSWDCEHGTSAYDRDQPWRVGKKRAGRLLDGREWNDYPAAVS